MEKYILLKVCAREFKKPNPEFLERPVKPLSTIQFLQKIVMTKHATSIIMCTKSFPLWVITER